MTPTFLLPVLLLCAVICLLAAFKLRGKSRALSLFAFFALVAVAVADTPVFTPGAASLSIETGNSVSAANGTVTNTFSPIFSGIPNVVVTPTGSAAITNYVSAVTVSNFVWTCGALSATDYWVAIGPR